MKQTTRLRHWMACSLIAVLSQAFSLNVWAQTIPDPNTGTLVFHAGDGSTFAAGSLGVLSDDGKTYTITNVGIGEDQLIKAYAPKHDTKPAGNNLMKYCTNSSDFYSAISDATPFPHNTKEYHLYAIWRPVLVEDFNVKLPDNLAYDGKEKKVEVTSKVEEIINTAIHVNYGSSTAPTDPGTYQILLNIDAGDAVNTINGFSVGMFTIEKGEQVRPAGVKAVNATAIGEKNGKLTSVSSDMEYRPVASFKYLPITGTEVTGLPVGNYYVRMKGDDKWKPSPDFQVLITDGNVKIYAVNYMMDDNDALYHQRFIYKDSLTAVPTEPWKNGSVFQGWVTSKGGTTKFDFKTPITQDVTLYMSWREVSRYTVKGKFSTNINNTYPAVSNAKVVINPLGVETTTNEAGEFTITAVPSGNYNISVSGSVSYGTELYSLHSSLYVSVRDQDVDLGGIEITPKIKNMLVVEAGAPAILVNGLKEVAEDVSGSDVLIKLIATPKTKDTATGGSDLESKIAADKKKMLSIFDFSVEKYVDKMQKPNLTDLSRFIDIDIPISEPMGQTTAYTLYRYHGIAKVQEITTTENADGEKISFSDTKKGYMTARLKKFSTYALASAPVHVVDFIRDEFTILFSKSVIGGSAIGSLGIITPWRDGYLFDGWYTDLNYQTLWVVGTDIVEHDMVLYAKWKQLIAVSGKITNVKGEPLPNTILTAVINGTTTELVAKSDAGGKYRLSNLQVNDGLHLNVVCEGYKSQMKVLIPIAPNSYELARDFVMEKVTANITGKVVDKQNKPIKGAWVRLLDGEDVKGRAATDKNGSYTISGMELGMYSILIACTGYKPSSIPDFELKEGGETCENVVLEKPGISGRVTDKQGQAFAGAKVQLLDASGKSLEELTTGVDGYYKFEELGDGTGMSMYGLLVSKSGYEPSRVGNIRPDTEDIVKDIVLTGVTINTYMSITGQVSDDQGRALAGAKVQLLDASGQSWYEATTNAYGSYWFWYLEEDTYGLLVSMDGYESRREENFILNTDITKDFVLMLIPTGLDEAEGVNTRVYGGKSVIVVEMAVGMDYWVIATSGLPIATGRSTDVRTLIPATSGMYLVRLGDKTYKVVVR